MEKRFALDLYGGKKAVLERMELLVRSKLASVSKSYKKDIYNELQAEGDFETIRILDGKKKVDFRTFDMLKDSYLEMNIGDVLGKADLSDSVIREYWTIQTKRNPMLISANKPDIDEKTLEEYVINSYVEKIAISELFADTKNKFAA